MTKYFKFLLSTTILSFYSLSTSVTAMEEKENPASTTITSTFAPNEEKVLEEDPAYDVVNLSQDPSKVHP